MTVARRVPMAVLMPTEDSTRMKAFPIICGNCRRRDGMAGTRFRTGVPWGVYQDHFMRKGWHLGHKPEEDRCPRCVEIAANERRAKTDVGKAAKKIAPPVAPAGPIVPLHAEQPAYHFGPSSAQLRELQAKFNKPAPPNGLELLRARIVRLERAVKTLMTERK